MIQLLDRNRLSTHELVGIALAAFYRLNCCHYRGFFYVKNLVHVTASWYISVDKTKKRVAGPSSKRHRYLIKILRRLASSDALYLQIFPKTKFYKWR